ncbi:MAG: RNA polymerase sigma factor [Bacteroidales bacterium]|nr:RNA polymerase sigma factor [Bacteroidales bacterium]
MTSKETHSAISAFLVTENKKLKNFIRSRLYNVEVDPEDIIQDVALNMFSRLDFDTPIRNIGAFIYQSIKNRIIDIKRKKNREIKYEEFTLGNDENIFIKTTADESLSYEDIEQEMLQEEVLHEALEKLNPGQREIIIATEFEGNTFEQLSKLWEVPIGTLLARKHRAVAKLHEIYYKIINTQL